MPTQLNLFKDAVLDSEANYNPEQQKQLKLFSAKDELSMLSTTPNLQKSLEEIMDRLTAALVGKKFMTEQGLSFAAGLTPSETSAGLFALKLAGRVVIKVYRKRVDEELISLA